jgi:3-dehydroquinate synthase II
LKEAWVYLEEWSKELITTAIENGADALVLPARLHDRVKALGRITTISPDGDLRPGLDVYFNKLESPEDEKQIGPKLAVGPIVLMSLPPILTEKEGAPESDSGAFSGTSSASERPSGRTWEIIPVENLIARGGRLIVPVHSTEDLDLALTVMEKGVAGVLLFASDVIQLKSLLKRVKTASESVDLVPAVVERIESTGIGDRVCVDTCTLMGEGEGMLVGNSSGFLFLVQAEAIPNPYVEPRPFRVNAGPVHSYHRSPGGSTRYLSELRAGDQVLIVRHDGSTQQATVGRVKIERRPLLLIEASSLGKRGSIILQNAETIRLTAPDGKAVSVVELKAGDSILIATEAEGRHFGMKVEETIWEK